MRKKNPLMARRVARLRRAGDARAQGVRARNRDAALEP